MKIAIFPGSFDPITLGHLDIITKSEKIFDKIIIAIGENNSKKNWLTTDEKLKMLRKCFKKNSKIFIQKYSTLTIKFCESQNANFIIRGLRNTIDFEHEKQLALMNEELSKSITTIFIPCSKKYSHISSTLTKEIINKNGAFEMFLPEEVISDIKNKIY